MLNKLRWIYTMQIIIFTVEKEINEAKEISFGIVRNLIGVVAFMTLILFAIFDLCA
jgi:hypothetical protein